MRRTRCSYLVTDRHRPSWRARARRAARPRARPARSAVTVLPAPGPAMTRTACQNALRAQGMPERAARSGTPGLCGAASTRAWHGTARHGTARHGTAWRNDSRGMPERAADYGTPGLGGAASTRAAMTRAACQNALRILVRPAAAVLLAPRPAATRSARQLALRSEAARSAPAVPQAPGLLARRVSPLSGARWHAQPRRCRRHPGYSHGAPARSEERGGTLNPGASARSGERGGTLSPGGAAGTRATRTARQPALRSEVARSAPAVQQAPGLVETLAARARPAVRAHMQVSDRVATPPTWTASATQAAPRVPGKRERATP